LSLADQVADLRAPTPSAAAELLAPDVQNLRREIDGLQRRSVAAVHARLDRARASTTASREQLTRRMDRRLQTAAEHVQAQADRLRALSPTATLSRGYAIARVDQRIVRDASTVEPGARLHVQLHRGQLTSTVQAIEPEAE
jgi:exodeoxyribonuclease VII large subunit